MKLTILGSGTCIPSRRRGSSGYLVETGDNRILFDCGNGTTWKLEQLNVSYHDIDYIFLTHFHPDHTADLIPFLFATKYPFNSQRLKPLKIYGPAGFERFYSNLTGAYGEWINPENLEIKEIENEFSTDDFSISTFKTLHTDNSTGYVLSHENKKLVYTGDTGYFDALCEICNDADIFIVECALPDSVINDRHMSPENISRILQNSNPSKTVLTHLYPPMDEMDLREYFSEFDNTEVIVAEDLMVIEV